MSGNFKDISLNNSRFERKFVLQNKGVLFAEHLVKLNQGFFKSIYQKRKVNNVYFDSPNLNNYYDNHFGKSSRAKVRIRWYGATFGKIENPVLEFKIKRGLVGRKESFPLKGFELNSNSTFKNWHSLFERSDLPDLVLNELKTLVPTLVNSYERKYYLSNDTNFRFTIDFNMKFFNTKSNGYEMSSFEEKDKVIMELKYDSEHDKAVKKITSSLPIRLNKFSKYVRGIELFHPHLAV